MSDDEIVQKVLAIIADTQRKKPEEVTLDSTFEQLGIDSMDGVNIIFHVEDAFNISVPDEEAKNIHSIRDIVDGVRKLVAPEQPR
jgi:acyl carrier protein